MNIRHKMTAAIVGVALAGVTLGFTQGRPEDNVGKRHPNLEAAQHLSTQAYNKLKAAQAANEYDLEGHAQKAEALLDQANREMAAAANFANHNKHPR